MVSKIYRKKVTWSSPSSFSLQCSIMTGIEHLDFASVQCTTHSYLSTYFHSSNIILHFKLILVKHSLLYTGNIHFTIFLGTAVLSHRKPTSAKSVEHLEDLLWNKQNCRVKTNSQFCQMWISYEMKLLQQLWCRVRVNLTPCRQHYLPKYSLTCKRVPKSYVIHILSETTVRMWPDGCVKRPKHVE